MNITELDFLCKKNARSVFEKAKFCLINHPFVGVDINENIINDVKEFQIKQVFGRKVLKEFIKNNSLDTPIQINIATQKTTYYENLILTTFDNYCKKL